MDVAAALAIGAAGYGASIPPWVKGTRDLGAARGRVIIATAPFIGAAIGTSSATISQLRLPKSARRRSGGGRIAHMLRRQVTRPTPHSPARGAFWPLGPLDITIADVVDPPVVR